MARELFGIRRPLIGVVHLPPLPGAPGYGGSMRRIIDRALRDAGHYLRGGFDGLIIENYGDTPFERGRVGVETVAALTRLATEVRNLGDFPLGINVLRSDGAAAMAIASCVGAEFIRVNVLGGAMVTDQGIIEGCAAEVLRLRAGLSSKVAVWADLLVKHAAPLVPTDPATAARDLVERAHADALILTGTQTGRPVEEGLLPTVSTALGGRKNRTPLLIGSGLQAENLESYWPFADGFIVGTSIKKGARTTNPVDPVRATTMAQTAKALRG